MCVFCLCFPSQRMCKAEIFDSVLTPERTKALEAIGFVWENREEKAVKKTWNERFQELLDYKAKHGHCDVPGAWWENPQLAQWVEKMRWIGGSGGLKEEQVVKLDEIGFQVMSPPPHALLCGSVTFLCAPHQPGGNDDSHSPAQCRP